MFLCVDIYLFTCEFWQVSWLSPCLLAFPIPQWLCVSGRLQKGITVAGTAQVFHLIPLRQHGIAVM